MVVRKGEMVNAIVDLRVRIPCSFCSEFEDGPVLSMFAVEKGNQLIEGVSIGLLWPDRAGSGGDDDCEGLSTVYRKRGSTH
jgi:hypothetical protein